MTGRSAAGTRGAALLSVGALLLAGCGGDDEVELEPGLVTSSSTTSKSNDEVAREQGRTMVAIYIDARDTVLADPETYADAQGMEGSAETSALYDVKIEASRLRSEDETRTGETSIAGQPEIVEVDLDPEQPSAPSSGSGSDTGSGSGAGSGSGSATGSGSSTPTLEDSVSTSGPAPATQPPFVELTACIDETGVSTGGSAGKRTQWRFSVVNRSWPNPERWRVAWVERTSTTC